MSSVRAVQRFDVVRVKMQQGSSPAASMHLIDSGHGISEVPRDLVEDVKELHVSRIFTLSVDLLSSA